MRLSFKYGNEAAKKIMADITESNTPISAPEFFYANSPKTRRVRIASQPTGTLIFNQETVIAYPQPFDSMKQPKRGALKETSDLYKTTRSASIY